MKLFFWLLSYLLLASSFMLFIRCAYYYDSKAICLYEKEISNKGSLIIERIKEVEGKGHKLAYSNSIVGSFYRASLYKEYIMNEDKLCALKFSSDEVKEIKENIIPGLEERLSLLNHVHCTITLAVVILGIIVGVLLRSL